MTNLLITPFIDTVVFTIPSELFWGRVKDINNSSPLELSGIDQKIRICHQSTSTRSSASDVIESDIYQIPGLGTCRDNGSDCTIQVTTRSLFGSPDPVLSSTFLGQFALNSIWAWSDLRLSRIDLAMDFESPYNLETVFKLVSNRKMLPAVVNGKRLPLWRNSTVYAKIYDKGQDRLRHDEPYVSNCYRLELTLRSKAIKTKKFMGKPTYLSDMIESSIIDDNVDSAAYMFELTSDFSCACDFYYSDFISYFCHFSLPETRPLLPPHLIEFWDKYKWSPSLARDSFPKTTYYRFVKELRNLGYYSYVDRPDSCSVDPRPFYEYFSKPHSYLRL